MSDDSQEPESKAGEPKPPKTKAEDNPWYLLATLYGVPESADDKLQQKNRIAWNRYFAAGLNEQTRKELIEEKRHTEEELTPFSPEELQEVETAFVERCKASAKKLALPASSASIDFSDVEFEQYAIFIGYLFSSDSSFQRSTFSGQAIFAHATFSHEANFASATFSDTVSFKSATFSDGADFKSATFSGVVAEFGSAVFFGEVTFLGATFSQLDDQMADFSSTIFSDSADFRRAVFSGDVCFDDAIFGTATATATATAREGAVSFERATISGRALFRATFHGESYFVNMEMKDKTSFEGAKFKVAPPEFFNAKLHEGTVWRDITWPPKPKDKDAAGSFVEAYERLKLEMNRLKKHEDELDFFALEMQSRRVLLGPARGLPIALYGLLSGYGRSYVRPLVALFVVAAIGAGAFLYFDARPCGEALGLSVANTLNAFGFRKDFDLAIDTPLAWLKVFSAAQTIVGTILLFLAGLGIRNKFRMK